ncbi:unnamed protein product [Amoebophrya sp. A120]|nr:unnamed protein product [Amoebophrya sp. A120]|eukprot:GSA120T00020808001.1
MGENNGGGKNSKSGSDESSRLYVDDHKIPRISIDHLTTERFCAEFLRPNKPVIITGVVEKWEVFQHWRSFDKFLASCGSVILPEEIIAAGEACGVAKKELNQNKPRTTVREFLETTRSSSSSRDDKEQVPVPASSCLPGCVPTPRFISQPSYLKDWHLQQLCEEGRLEFDQVEVEDVESCGQQEQREIEEQNIRIQQTIRGEPRGEPREDIELAATSTSCPLTSTDRTLRSTSSLSVSSTSPSTTRSPSSEEDDDRDQHPERKAAAPLFYCRDLTTISGRRGFEVPADGGRPGAMTGNKAETERTNTGAVRDDPSCTTGDDVPQPPRPATKSSRASRTTTTVQQLMCDYQEKLPDFLGKSFQFDWLNHPPPVGLGEDYRFCYAGRKGTATAPHFDVLCSYSWSANICGRKFWRLFSCADFGSLVDEKRNVIDYRGPESFAGDHGEHQDGSCQVRTNDCDQVEEISGKQQRHHPQVYRVVQNPGELFFVPACWVHDVVNITDAVSINHNWLNAFSLDRLFDFLVAEQQALLREVAEYNHQGEKQGNDCEVLLCSSLSPAPSGNNKGSAGATAAAPEDSAPLRGSAPSVSGNNRQSLGARADDCSPRVQDLQGCTSDSAGATTSRRGGESQNLQDNHCYQEGEREGESCRNIEEYPLVDPDLLESLLQMSAMCNFSKFGRLLAIGKKQAELLGNDLNPDAVAAIASAERRFLLRKGGARFSRG